MAQIPFFRRKPFQLVASAVVLVWLASSLQWSDVLDFMRRGNPWMLLLLALFFPLDRLFMAWKWHLLVKATGNKMRLWDAIRIYLASGVVGLIVPLGGMGPDVVRVAMLARHGMPTEVSVPSVLVERICGVLGSFIMLAGSILLIVLLLGVEVATPLTGMLWGVTLVGLSVVGAFAATYGLRGSPRIIGVLTRWIDRFGLRTHFQALIWYAGRGRLLAISILLSWVEQWASIIAFYLACVAFSVPLGLLQCAAIVPLASILERLPISFGGIGMREAGIVFVAGMFGVSTAEAFLVSIANYTIFLLTMLPLSTLYFVERKQLGPINP